MDALLGSHLYRLVGLIILHFSAVMKSNSILGKTIRSEMFERNTISILLLKLSHSKTLSKSDSKRNSLFGSIVRCLATC